MANFTKDKNRTLLPVGALGLSAFFHGALLLFIGGTVLIETVIPKTAFKTYEMLPESLDQINEVSEEEAQTPIENDPLPSNEPLSEPQSAQPSELTQTNDVILVDSNSSQPMFSIPPPSAPVLSGAMPQQEVPNEQNKKPVKTTLRNMTSLFGSKEASSDAMSGYLYDLKQTSDKKPSDMASFKGEVVGKSAQNDRYMDVVTQFISKNWDEKILEPYFKTPKPLSSYMVFIPRMPADEAPKAFEVEKNVDPRRWVIHYKGVFEAPVSGRFRFVGRGDDILIVRFDKKDVFDGSLAQVVKGVKREPIGARMNDTGKTETDKTFLLGGDWFNITQGQSYPIEVLLGEQPGGVFFGFLMIEESGKKYEQRPDNKGPILPLFQMSPTKIPRYDPEKLAPTVAKEGFASPGE